VLRPADNAARTHDPSGQGPDRHGKISGQATREQDLRSFLGTFNFSGDMVKQAVGSMSGGEKARLVLCMIVWQRPNLLLLDEPTNHLDLATREALSMALNEFEGTVMLVSHDRALLRAVCDEFWLVSRGGVEPFDGDLDDYQRYLLDEARRHRGTQVPGKAGPCRHRTHSADHWLRPVSPGTAQARCRATNPACRKGKAPQACAGTDRSPYCRAHAGKGRSGTAPVRSVACRRIGRRRPSAESCQRRTGHAGRGMAGLERTAGAHPVGLMRMEIPAQRLALHQGTVML
jgi:energy-coupling factor transporter ATP-binding protein EcfA2